MGDMWSMRRDRAAGITLVLVPTLIIASFLIGAENGEYDPFERGDTVALLEVYSDHARLFAVSLAAIIIIDGIWLPIAAGLLYLSFRDRSPAGALLGTTGLLLSTGLFLVHDATVMSLPWLAADFADEGGPAGIAAGSEVILMAARTVNLVQASIALCALTVMGLALTAFGALWVWAPAGQRNPPRLLGTLMLGGGIGYLCTWTFLLNHTVGGAITLVSELAVLVSLAWLGIWFLRQDAGDRRSVGPES
jgi:hypothetical protein